MKYFAIIGVLALLVIAACQPVVIQDKDTETKDDTISVSSTKQLEEKADEVQIRLGVETLADDAETSQEENARIANAIIEAIKEVGISEDDLSTAGFNVYPRNEWDSDLRKSVLKGYQTTNTVLVKTAQIDLAGKILDAASKAGANRVNSVQFTLSNDKQELLKAEALKGATKDARVKAMSIAEGLGVKLGSVASVSEGNFYSQPYMMRTMEAFALEGDSVAAAPPIIAGDVTVSATVTVQYRIG